MRGYSLVELIVAIGIFSMVMLIVTGVYLALISYDREARATNQLVANLSFSVESMVRNIRTGTDYTCSGTPCSLFSFNNSEGTAVSYCRLSDGTIGQRIGGSVSGSDCLTSANTVPLTDPHINIQTLAFYVSGVAEETLQPRVTVVIRGTMQTDSGEDIDFTIQTSGTQRLLDIF
jgi:prepilin-type N-terminal cleavage/methylation domain-containing protein